MDEFTETWENEVGVEVTILHAADYVFIWRDVKPSGWGLKMLWARLLRRKLEVYTHPKRMTDLELAEAILTAEEMGCVPEVYARLNFEGTSDSTDKVVTNIPNEGDK